MRLGWCAKRRHRYTGGEGGCEVKDRLILDQHIPDRYIIEKDRVVDDQWFTQLLVQVRSGQQLRTFSWASKKLRTMQKDQGLGMIQTTMTPLWTCIKT